VQRLVAALAGAGWNRRNAPVFIQSFEQSNLMQLDRMTPVRLVQVIDANDVNPDGSLDFTAPLTARTTGLHPDGRSCSPARSASSRPTRDSTRCGATPRLAFDYGGNPINE
jgi:glycerophosphoryl diester phosphodiesterase